MVVTTTAEPGTARRRYGMDIFLKVVAIAGGAAGLCVGLLLVLVFVATAGAPSDTATNGMYLGLIGLPFLAFGLWMLLLALVSELELSPDKITMRGIFRQRSLARNKIAYWEYNPGFRAGLVIVYPRDPEEDVPVSIPTYLRGTPDLMSWLAAFPDHPPPLQAPRLE